MSFFCATRALKNARHVQRVAPHLVPAEEPAEGFASRVPLDMLSRLHLMVDAELAGHPDLLPVAKSLRAALLKPRFERLFQGTLHFVQVQFHVAGAVTVVSDADMATMVEYAQLAVPQIVGYASRYGPITASVSSDVLRFAVEPLNGTFNDGDLQGWVNRILTRNQLPAGSTALVIPHPRGTTNTDGDATKGVGGYHGKANCPYSYVNVFGTGFTVADEKDTQAADHYALQLSHEIAEMLVDPDADDSNPEVCDPCGPNCGRVWRDFFYAPPINAYMMTTQQWPATFPYGYMMNAIVQPEHSGDCPAAQSACAYSPAKESLGELVFYEASGGVGEIYGTNPPMQFDLQNHQEGWRNDWSLIVPGHFAPNNQFSRDLLFYEASSGTGEFYRVDTRGNMTLLRTNTGWRNDWAMIIPGKFSDSPYTDLLFYEPASGTGEFWRTDGNGGISRIGGSTDWRGDWTMILPGKFSDGPYTDLLFYQRESGIGDFWRTDGHGNVSRIGGSTDWRQDWTMIRPGTFAPGGRYTDLLFYQRESGIGSFWRTDGGGNVAELMTATNWRSSWSIILKD